MPKPEAPEFKEPENEPDEVDKPDEKPDETDEPDDDTGDANKLGDAGKKALESMKRERNAARKERQELLNKLKEYQDKDKTESQRLQEAAEEAKSRAAKAEGNAKKLQTAIDRAPEGASLTQIKAVAKRLHGETDEDLEADADELFALLTPSTQDTKKPLPHKPRENLSGGGDPDEEPEEKDPRKLADLIGRH